MNENEFVEHRYDAGHIPQEPKKSSGIFKKIVILIFSAILFGAIAGTTMIGIVTVKEYFYPGEKAEIENTEKKEKKDDLLDTKNQQLDTVHVTATDVSEIVEQVMPSVVSITATVETNNYFYGKQESQGAGSGFIIANKDDTIYVATNHHVVNGAKSLTVAFIDGSTANARIVGLDKDADLAVIAVKAGDLSEETSKKIKVALLGESDSMKVGQPVIAIGNALGYGQSVTTGVISAKDREVSFTDGTMTLLQTDAAINPGNSGGVLINEKGEVIGINNAKLSDTSVEGMGYAIPMTTARSILTELMAEKPVKEGNEAFLGVVGKTLDETYSEALGMPSGIYVSQVIAGSPAEAAGISAGDIITGYEGNNVSSMSGLKEKLSRKSAGDKVKITIQRADQNGKYSEQIIEVVLGKASDFADVTVDEQEQNNENQQQNPYDDRSQSGEEYYYDNRNGSGGQYIDPFDFFFGNGGY